MPNALVVVDMQEYFCRSEYSFIRFMSQMFDAETVDWYRDWLDNTVIPNVSRLLDAARQRGDLVVFTEFGSRTASGEDLPLWARRYNDMAQSLIGERAFRPLVDPSARVIAELAPHASDVIVQKSTSGPLAGTDIAERLRTAGVDRVVVTGVATDVCVTGMARELADSDFDVLVPSDACGTPVRDSQSWVLTAILPAFARVVTTGDLDGAEVGR